MYRDIERRGSVGGHHAGAFSRGIRWLWKRTYAKRGIRGFAAPMVEVRRGEYEYMVKELRRLRKERKVLLGAEEADDE